MTRREIIILDTERGVLAWEAAKTAAKERLREDLGVEDPDQERIAREVCECYVGLGPEFNFDDS